MTIVVVFAVWFVAALVFALALGPLLGAVSSGRPAEPDEERRARDLARSA